MTPAENFIINFGGIATFIIGFSFFFVVLAQGTTANLAPFLLTVALVGLLISAVNIIAPRIAARKAQRKSQQY